MSSNGLFKECVKKAKIYTGREITNMVHSLNRYKKEDGIAILKLKDMGMDSKKVHVFDHFRPSSLISLLRLANTKIETEIADKIFASALSLNIFEDGETFVRVSIIFKSIIKHVKLNKFISMYYEIFLATKWGRLHLCS